MNQSDPNLIKSLRYVIHIVSEFEDDDDIPYLNMLSRHVDELEAHKSLWIRIDALEDKIKRLEAKLKEATREDEHQTLFDGYADSH